MGLRTYERRCRIITHVLKVFLHHCTEASGPGRRERYNAGRAQEYSEGAPVWPMSLLAEFAHQVVEGQADAAARLTGQALQVAVYRSGAEVRPRSP